MAKPVILSTDDEPQVLNAVVRDLRKQYGKDYRVMSAPSGADALEALQALKQRGEQVALLIADQRMPSMSGTELLEQARKLFPDARKVLLTAYADTEAAIASINAVALDYYLLKPWDPPEETLYPVIDDLLGDWWLSAQVPYDGIRVAGTLWSAHSHHVKDFLARNRVPYQWLDIEVDAEAAAMVDNVLGAKKELPVVFLPDGDALIAPDSATLAQRVGLKTEASAEHYDLVIVGGGPAGLGAGVYGASEGLKTLMIEKAATGGQAGTSSRIENYLGFPNGLSGSELAKRATDQAVRLGCEIVSAVEVNEIRVEDPYKIVCLSNGVEISCKALLIATGVELRELDVPGMQPLSGAGVYYGAALTEARHYAGKQVFVVGGANSAGQGAMYFARFAEKVTILVRGSGLQKGMSQYLVDQIEAQPNIEVRTHHEVRSVAGENRLQRITYFHNETGAEATVDADALFIFIGAMARTEMVADVVARNRTGFIITGPDLLEGESAPNGWKLKRAPYFLETSVPGIFAAGDVRHGAVRRVASAVGQGAIAVSLVHQYLKTV